MLPLKLIYPGSFVLLGGLIILGTYISYLLGGEISSIVVIFVSVILLGGLLFGSRGALIVFLVFAGQQALLSWAGNEGSITRQIVRPGLLADFLIVTIGYFVALLVFQLAYSSLSKQLEASRSSEKEARRLAEELDVRIRERTDELNKRSTQLEAAALVTRAAAEIRGQKELLETIVQQISERFGFYHAGIFLADANGEYITLEAASSDGGKKMLQHGHKLAIGRQGIVGFAAYQKRPRIAQDVGADANFFNNPELPETHSEMALPLLARNRLVGVLDIQSEEHNAFSSDDISTLEIMTDQIALAIENARLLSESRSAIDQLQTITTENIGGTWRERLGHLRKGYSFSSAGISAISPTEEGNSNHTPRSGHTIKIPIALRGQRIGQLVLSRKSNESPWTEIEQEMADKIAIQVALAIENARLLEESQRRALREQTVNDLSSRFSRSLDVDTLLQNAVRELHRLPQVSEVSVYIAPESTES
jgi:GAF domain-containing protein